MPVTSVVGVVTDIDSHHSDVFRSYQVPQARFKADPGPEVWHDGREIYSEIYIWCVSDYGKCRSHGRKVLNLI